ncbi:site-specific integrase [Parafrankia sp. FMc6]|uniref:tyrosine-type recombinase/integrase n=1 Tax=Parafrankia soli TaxID=2599596 RepID=UPI0034D4B2A9
MRDPTRVEVTGPLAPYAEGFRGELTRLGYGRDTTALQLWLMDHLSRWLEGRGLDGTGLTPGVVAAFVAERRAAGYAHHRCDRAMNPLLSYLRRQGVAAPSAVCEAELPSVERLLARYARYLVEERGLVKDTVERNVALVRPFLETRVAAGDGGLREMSAGDVTAFVLAVCRARPTATASRTMTALRSLLRFLHVEGLIGQSLVDAVPPVAAWKLAGVPRALDAGQVGALLASCDRDAVVGRRDLAILTVLVRLGLRAGEVAGLRLGDLDWRRGEVTVRGKGNRQECLPLPVDVGEALVAYLTDGRPAGAGREVFLQVRPPRGAMTRGAVTQLVARAARRAGLGTFFAHRLRHTAATGMLRGGGSLAEIGQVLRHRHALTTAIYAKVDLDALRPLARPWPAGAR